MILTRERKQIMRIRKLSVKIPALAAMLFVALTPGCKPNSPEESVADNNEPNAVSVVAPEAKALAVTEAKAIAVTVNGIDILESEVEKLVRPQLDAMAKQNRQLPPNVAGQFRRHAMEQLIRERLLDGKIEQAKIVITDEEVMSQIEEIVSAQGLSLVEFVQTVERNGHGIEEVKQDLRKRLARNKFMQTQWAGKINVTEDEAKKFYDENPKKFDVPELVRVSHILITSEPGGDPNEAKAKAKAKTQDLLEQIRDGADLAELAKIHSVCPSAPNGGDLNFFPRGEATPAFDKVAFELEVGQISDVVETEYGFHIIKATDRKDPGVITFEQAREKIIEQLTDEKQSEFTDEYLKKLKAEAEIVYPTNI